MGAPTFLLRTPLPAERVEAFARFLAGLGCSRIPTTNEYELIRWQMADGSTGILYEGRRGQAASSSVAFDAVHAFVNGARWETRPEPTKRTSRTGRARRMRERLAVRDGACCMYCGEAADVDELTVEHVVPLAAGGPDTLVNMGLACLDCNGELDALPPARKIARAIERRREAETA